MSLSNIIKSIVVVFATTSHLNPYVKGRYILREAIETISTGKTYAKEQKYTHHLNFNDFFWIKLGMFSWYFSVIFSKFL